MFHKLLRGLRNRNPAATAPAAQIAQHIRKRNRRELAVDEIVDDIPIRALAAAGGECAMIVGLGAFGEADRAFDGGNEFSDGDAVGFAAQAVTAFEASTRADETRIDEQAQQFAHCRIGQSRVLHDGFSRHLLGVAGQAIGDQQAVIR